MTGCAVVLCCLLGLTADSQGAGEEGDGSGLLWHSSGVLVGEKVSANFTSMGHTCDLLF